MKFPAGRLFQQLSEEQHRDDAPPLEEATPVDDAPPADEQRGWELALKRKRRAVLMRHLLADSGYGDLAKMVNIKER